MGGASALPTSLRSSFRLQSHRSTVSDPQIYRIRLCGEHLESHDGETWITPKGLVSPGLLVNDLPRGARLEIGDHVENDVMIPDTIPMTIERFGPNQMLVMFEDSGTRKYWDGKVGFKAYMEAKKAAVEDRASQERDVALQNHEDDGAWIHLAYNVTIEAVKVCTVIEMAEQVVAEIEGAAEMRLGVELWTPSEAENEKDFTLRTNVRTTKGDKIGVRTGHSPSLEVP